MIKYFVAALIFFIPLSSLFVLHGAIIWYAQFLAVLLIGFLLASSIIWKHNKYLAILTFYSALSYVFIAQQHPRALMCVVAAYAGAAIICAASKIKDTRLIYNAIKLMAAFQIILLTLQYFNLDPFFKSLSGAKQVVGFAGSSNQLGAYYAAIIPILGWLFPVAIIAIFASKCSSAFIGAIVGLSVLLFYRSKKLLISVAAVILIFSLIWANYDKSFAPFKERMKLWEFSINQVNSGKMYLQHKENITQILTANPLFGYGIGSFFLNSHKSQWKIMVNENGSRKGHIYEHAHNDLVELLFDFGYIGLFIVLCCVGDIFCKFRDSFKTTQVIKSFSALVAISVTSLGIYVIHAPLSYFIFCLILGLFYAEIKNEEQSSNKAEAIT